MKYIFFFILLLITFVGCKDSSAPFIKETIALRLNNTIYDSVQVFVDVNINANSKSEVYLLEFADKKSDSVNYILTCLTKKSINRKYRNSLYFYNVDSSILIVKSSNDCLYNDSNIRNTIKNAKDLVFSNDTSNIIFNPLIWKFTIVDERVYVDRYYGMREAEKNVITPKKKFIPPAVP